MESKLNRILRLKPGYAGDTARTLTEYYYNYLFDKKDLYQSAYDLITYRTNFYMNFEEVNCVSQAFINATAELFHDNLPCILFMFFYLENAYDNEQREFIENNIGLIYSVVVEEHVKKANELNFGPITRDMSESESSILGAILEEQIDNPY